MRAAELLFLWNSSDELVAPTLIPHRAMRYSIAQASPLLRSLVLAVSVLSIAQCGGINIVHLANADNYLWPASR